jgi:hypothetical protein
MPGDDEFPSADVFTMPGEKPSAGSSRAAPGSAGLVREAEKPTSGFGRGPIAPDGRKFKYDMYRARGTKVAFSVTRDDRMSAESAGTMLHTIHERLGIDRVEEHFILAFDKALFFAHTVNSGSVLQPGRAKLYVDGLDGVDATQFDYNNVLTILGNDMRRFFRAYADDITEVNRAVLAAYDPYNPVAAEQHGWIMQVATERGLQRYPYLAHDSADACININTTERLALINSKRAVLASVTNSADRAFGNPRVQTADKFDSTTGEVV